MRYVFCLFVIGCTSGSQGSVSGNLPGGGLQVADQISAVVTMDSDSDARILLTNTMNLCQDVSASIDRKGEHYVMLVLHDVTATAKTAPTAPGTYTIYPNTGSEPAKSAVLTAGGFDANCQPNDAESAQGQSGTVTLSMVSGNVFAGTYDVVLNSGGHITGSFQPEACPSAAAALANSDGHSCQ